MNKTLGTITTTGSIYITSVFIYITEQQSCISNSIWNLYEIL